MTPYLQCTKCKGNIFRIIATKLNQERKLIDDFNLECATCGDVMD